MILSEEDLKKIKEGKGLGSAIEVITGKLGIKPCGGCKKRKEWLDKKVPFDNSGRV